jgi:hypothetical protein
LKRSEHALSGSEAHKKFSNRFIMSVKQQNAAHGVHFMLVPLLLL